MANVPQLFYFVTLRNIYQLLHNKYVISSIIHKFRGVDLRCGSSVKSALTAMLANVYMGIMPNISSLQ